MKKIFPNLNRSRIFYLKHKIEFLYIFVLSIIAMLFETLSIASVFPFF